MLISWDKKIKLGVRYTYDRFFEDRCFIHAAALSYASLLSLVPLMLVSFFVLSWVPALRAMGHVLQDFVIRNFVADSAHQISQQLLIFLQQMQKLSLANILFLVLVCVIMIYNMVTAFNEIWHVKLERHLALSFIIYLVVLLLTPLLFGLLLAVTSYVTSLPFIMQFKAVEFIKTPTLIILPYVVAFVVFTFFNWVLPSCRVKFRYAALTGLLTTICFEIAKRLFVWYVQYVPTYKLIYGALAVIPIFLIWLYVCWSIILLGALFCHIVSTGLPEELLSAA
ncbi:MAG: YihY family inner membrane protein [Gammaproteobacteria bacterium]|nr:YihY family inner membrane protein [Gammaproteobacteria bacterium]